MQRGDTVVNKHSNEVARIVDIEYDTKIEDGPVYTTYVLNISGIPAPSIWSDIEMAEHWNLVEEESDAEG